MKKILTVISIFVLGLVLVSCGKSNNDFQVDVFIYNEADTYIGSVRAELKRQLDTVEGVKTTFHDGKDNQVTQSEQIDGAIAKGTNLLVVNIVSVEAADTVISKAKAANIPVLFFNREISDAAVKSYEGTAFIGTDPDEAGYMQGELAVDIILKDYAKYDRNSDGNIGYAMLRADGVNPEALGRTQYSVEEANRLFVASSKPQLVQIGSTMDADWDSGKANTAISALISNEDNLAKLDVIFANNDDMALGAIQALQALGYNKNDATKHILVLGVDATAAAQAAIKDGSMDGSIKQDGEAMATAIKSFIANKAAGKGYLEGTTYKFETGVDKLRIPYAKYVG